MLETLQSMYGLRIESALASAFQTSGLPEDFSGMLQYQLGLTDAALRPVPTFGGKRFRPLLCLLACTAVGGIADAALRVAVAIELLHNFSLIHDDIEDKDPERRHRPTLWKVWGEPHAINAGDAMFALACSTIAVAVPDVALTHQLSERFHATSLLLTGGQYLDMSFEDQYPVTREEYLEMISGKTGALVSFSLWAGALTGGANVETRDALHCFGLELGRAFQIRDDVQGVWASSAVTGKERGKDILNRKKTLPVLFGAETDDTHLLEQYYRGGHANPDEVVGALDAAGARERSEAVVHDHYSAALTALDAAEIAPSERDMLRRLATELAGQ